jgi:hypothetical protein
MKLKLLSTPWNIKPEKKYEESGDRRERDELLNIFGMRDTGKKT